jgi:hypothetical protein
MVVLPCVCGCHNLLICNPYGDRVGGRFLVGEVGVGREIMTCAARVEYGHVWGGAQRTSLQCDLSRAVCARLPSVSGFACLCFVCFPFGRPVLGASPTSSASHSVIHSAPCIGYAYPE